jgi:hypothetical protein
VPRNRLFVFSADVIPGGAKSLAEDSILITDEVGPGVMGFPSSSRSGFIARCDSLSLPCASNGASTLLPRLVC